MRMQNHLRQHNTHEDGFTLIELLIVVLIIGILAAIAIPVYLGIQAQGYKSVVKADVNQGVKRIQVAVTEGTALATVKANYTDYGVKASRPDESVVVYDSPSAPADKKDTAFQVVGTMDKTATPKAGPINYTYSYDSATGKFSESDTATSMGIVLGSGTGNLPDGLTGSNYTAQIDATVTGGSGTTQYNVTSGSLPTGYTLNQSTGAITGNTSAAGTYPLTVTVTNGSLTSSRPYVLRVYTKPAVNTTNLPAAVVGTAYNQTLDFTGSPAPTFAVTSGSLPGGLNLDSATGKISGTPTTSGSSSFAVTATNGGGSGSSSNLTIVVNQAPTITTANLPDATVGTAYDYTVTTNGAPAPTFSATNLPSGLSITPATGRITGTPDSSAGATSPNVTITANNGIGGDQTKTLTLNVNAVAPTITSSGFNSGKVGSAYSATLTSTGGTGSVTWVKSSGSLPPGLSLANNGVISGTPTGTYADYTFGVTATASGKTSAEKVFTLKIAQDINIANANVESGNTSQWYSYWTVSNTTTSDFGATSSNSHTGSWSEYFKTLNNNGYVQGLLYCPGVAYQTGVRVRWTAYVSGVADPAWSGGTAYNLSISSRANNWDGWGSQAVTVNGQSDWHQVSMDFIPDGNGGPLCLTATVQQNSSADYFKKMWVDDVTLTLGG